MSNGKKPFEILKELDTSMELIKKEGDPGRKIEITAGMIRHVGYAFEEHRQSDGLFRLRTCLIIGGLTTAILGEAYGLWWLIQQHIGG